MYQPLLRKIKQTLFACLLASLHSHLISHNWHAIVCAHNEGSIGVHRRLTSHIKFALGSSFMSLLAKFRRRPTSELVSIFHTARDPSTAEEASNRPSFDQATHVALALHDVHHCED